MQGLDRARSVGNDNVRARDPSPPPAHQGEEQHANRIRLAEQRIVAPLVASFTG